MIRALAGVGISSGLILSTTLAFGFVVAEPVGTNHPAERIELVFEAAAEATPETISYQAAPSAECQNDVWPHIDPSCLVNDTGAQATAVRVVY